jgi:uncharacterized membrane protein
MMQTDVTTLDIVALALFLALWAGYARGLRLMSRWLPAVNSHLPDLRREWMRNFLARENRIGDAALIGHAIHSVTFFASATVLVLGALIGVWGNLDQIHAATAQLGFVRETSRSVFELKLAILFLIFIVAFVRFTWSVRQYNYGIAMMGAAPPPQAPADERERTARLIAVVLSEAGASFDGRLRAYYFALATIGWYVDPWLFMAATVAVVALLLRRQLFSPTARALRERTAPGG